jgi:hypothetical protein
MNPPNPEPSTVNPNESSISFISFEKEKFKESQSEEA